jgi:outer membrane lipoprotein-sorting protein
MLSRRSLAIAGAFVFTAMLAGCGVQTQSPFGQGRHGHALAVRSDAKADQLIAGLKGASAQLKTFSGVARFWETDGKEVSTNTAEIYMALPNKIRANITEASSMMKRGAKLVYLGDGKITAKVGFIKKTLAYDDPQVLSVRGWRIDQTDLGAIIKGATDANAKARYVGPTTLGGRAAEVLELASPSFLPGTTKQVVALDAQTFVPLKVEGFAGEQSVYKMELSNTQVNPTLPDDIFKL